FERFYRASNVAHKIEGTGIGLTGSRQIVEEHAGRIMVESEEHAGTTVTLLLPLTTLDPSVFLAVSDVPATSA
ncbi:MAG TPA: sensor histidine kinase, partial [Chloroflexota bacterium]|nr:sensor histidine kinase [Chloroflexota bacterium]